MNTRTPFLQKVALIAFGLLCAVFLLEAGLRFASFVLLSFQEYRNKKSLSQKDSYRIMCLGESMTAHQYPAVLENVLNQRRLKMRFSVLDRGVVATDTPTILWRLEENLAAYKPDMVVAMMGHNDRRIVYYQDAPEVGIGLFRHCKVYKLLRLLYVQLFKKLKSIAQRDSEYTNAHATLGVLSQNSGQLSEAEELFRKAIAGDPGGSDAYIKLGILYQNSGQLSEAEELFRKIIARDPRNSGAYIRLGQACANRGRPAEAEAFLKKAVELAPRDSEACLNLGKFYQRKHRLAEAEPLLKKAIELDARNGEAYMRLAQLYRRLDRFLEAEAAYKKAAEFNLLESENSITELADLYWQQGKLSEVEELLRETCSKDPRNDTRNEVLYRMLERLYRETKRTKLAHAYKKRIDGIESDSYGVVTADNYRTLKEILDKKGIRLVCVQYPMRSIGPLKKIFQGSEKGIIFVDNEKLFRDAVSKDGYATYFKDMFAGDFGHCTDRGNRLLAEHIADAIVTEVFRK